MKKIMVLLFLYVISSVSASAQINYEITRAMEFFRMNKNISGEWKNLLTQADIKGTPYANDEFVTGTIFTVQMQQIVDIELRYNIYNDQMEFKNGDGQILYIAAPEIIKSIEIDSLKMAFIPFSVSKKIQKGYFTVAEEGKASLYSRQEKIFKEAVLPAAYKDAEPASFLDRPNQLFIRVGESEAKLVNGKKDLLEIFPDNQDALEKFIKDNKTKINKPEELAKLVKFYNSL